MNECMHACVHVCNDHVPINRHMHRANSRSLHKPLWSRKEAKFSLQQLAVVRLIT